MLLLTGCGVSGTATPAAPGATTEASAPSAAPPPSASGTSGSQTSSGSPRSRDTSGPSFGVDRVRWPATAKGASELLNGLPQTFGGESLEVYYQPADTKEELGATAGAQYGDAQSITVSDEFVTSDTASGKPELLSAEQLLAASFGLVFGCAKNSYRGTIEPGEGGYGPGSGPSKKSSGPRWFSCAIDVAEGDDDFTGHAVGWTSGKAAWLVIAEDATAARSLIAALEAPGK